jgi:hypothetical protein
MVSFGWVSGRLTGGRTDSFCGQLSELSGVVNQFVGDQGLRARMRWEDQFSKKWETTLE